MVGKVIPTPLALLGTSQVAGKESLCPGPQSGIRDNCDMGHLCRVAVPDQLLSSGRWRSVARSAPCGWVGEGGE